jgi:hypothetical protein
LKDLSKLLTFELLELEFFGGYASPNILSVADKTEREASKKARKEGGEKFRTELHP